MGSLRKVKAFASENPNSLPQLQLRGLDFTSQVAAGVSFPLSVPIDGAWPDRFGLDERGYCITAGLACGGAWWNDEER